MAKVREKLASGEFAKPSIKEKIGLELDNFVADNNLQSLRDRLNIGLNEVGILAHEVTNKIVKRICRKMAGSKEESEKIYQEALGMCVDIQRFGPWDYVQELSKSDTKAAKAWFMLTLAEVDGYEKEKVLNDKEFKADLERIKRNLKQAEENPNQYLEKARQRLLSDAKKKVRFDFFKDAKGKKTDVADTRAPMGDGFEAFIPIAMMGYEAGVCQDADGWVFVGAKGEISDKLLKNCGLEARKRPDERDPKRILTYYYNKDGQEVAKKVHPGLLVILTRSFDIARSITRAVNNQREVIEVAEDALTHTRVIQTSEKKKLKTETEKWNDKAFLKMPGRVSEQKGVEKSTAILRPKEDFYDRMHIVRGLYVYLDALDVLTRKKTEAGLEVTEQDKEQLIANVWEKMGQKVEELKYIIGLIDKDLEDLSSNVNSVIDMAGGAGDLGLAVTNYMLSSGREMERVEIVDPQPGVDKFMESIITYLPFRKKLEEIAVHNSSYLQDAKITPDSIVVAKHACGTLTDDTIELWMKSESPYMCAMTCCQDKAADNPARYGLSQADWHKFCMESGGTNIKDDEIPSAPGKKRESMLKKREMGKKAMYELDMARVNYLRRMGFAAELQTTDKFPKGDVIIARRLPANFMEVESRIKLMEKSDPKSFDAMMLYIDRVINNRKIKSTEGESEFGANWIKKDFVELRRRLDEEKEALKVEKIELKMSTEVAEKQNKNAEKELIRVIFPDISGGRIDLYISGVCERSGISIRDVNVGKIAGTIKEEILKNKEMKPSEIREIVDKRIAEIIKDFVK